MRITLRKDNSEVSTKRTLKYEPPGRKEIIFKEELSITTTLSKDKNTKEFQDKTTRILAEVYTAKGYKPTGMVELNLKDYLNINTFQVQEVKLQKCTDKNARINFSIRAKSIENENLYLPNN
jgi:hypothetical protein